MKGLVNNQDIHIKKYIVDFPNASFNIQIKKGQKKYFSAYFCPFRIDS
tara:strand:+ start:1141 stop:1284 length:144 start_codon:yes stop_codon:yes gene_type:complete